jgi:cytochrome c oxidase cbb3-type subunit III
MTPQSTLLAVAASMIFACSACNSSPGRPAPDSEVISPSQIAEFSILYTQNCAGCHGSDGKGGAALALADPVYLAIADDAVIRHTAALGVSGTPMPAFAESAGGMLTEKQIDVIVSGIRAWGTPDLMHGSNPPPYAAQESGDPKRGADVYATYCASCHGPNGRGGKASSIVNGAYLALVSDQQLRTIVIAGRPELGAPDWRGNLPGKPMSAQEVSDVVAWLVAQRPEFAGRPYPVQGSAAGGHP